MEVGCAPYACWRVLLHGSSPGESAECGGMASTSIDEVDPLATKLMGMSLWVKGSIPPTHAYRGRHQRMG